MRWLREPLLHFVVLGGALLWWLRDDGAAATGDEIVVSAARVEQLVTGFERAWLRPPTAEERDRLIEDWIREEVLVREARRLGLDRDDTIVRKHLARKLAGVGEDLAGDLTPTDEELRAHLAAHADAFRLEARLTFAQVFLDPGERGDRLDADVARLLAELRGAGTRAEPAALGDASLLPSTFDDVPIGRVRARFGDAFAQAVAELEPGDWRGPVASGFGVHLVRVAAREQARVPAVAEIREALERHWLAAQREDARERFVTALRERYRLRVEGAR